MFGKKVCLGKKELVKFSRVTLGKVERGELGNTFVKTLDIILASLGFGLPSLDEL